MKEADKTQEESNRFGGGWIGCRNSQPTKKGAEAPFPNFYKPNNFIAF